MNINIITLGNADNYKPDESLINQFPNGNSIFLLLIIIVITNQ